MPCWKPGFPGTELRDLPWHPRRSAARIPGGGQCLRQLPLGYPNYYLQSPHAGGARRTQVCDLPRSLRREKPSEAMFQGAEPRRDCGSCHAPDTPEGQSAQSMYDSIDSAAQAYADAETAVQVASDVGMLVAEEEALLQKANTNLVTARARPAHHSTKPTW